MATPSEGEAVRATRAARRSEQRSVAGVDPRLRFAACFSVMSPAASAASTRAIAASLKAPLSFAVSMPRRFATSFSIASRFGRFASSPLAASAPPVPASSATTAPAASHRRDTKRFIASSSRWQTFLSNVCDAPKSSMRASGAGARRRPAPPRRSPSRRGSRRPAARLRARARARCPARAAAR